MTLPPGDFSRLLRELRGAGPLDRLRLLARSLAALRGLSPWDRKVLLRMAGLEGAEALVERLAGDDRETAQALTRVLAELEAHPDELDRTVRKLADPKRRVEAVDELLETLDRVAAPDEDAPAPPARAPKAAEPPPPPPPAPEPPPARPQPSEDPARTVEPEPPPKPAPPKPTAPPPAAAPVHREAATAPRPKAPPAPTPPARPAEPALPPESPSAVAALKGLLELRRRLDRGRPPDVQGLRRLLEREMPFPWARRRALQAWIEAGGAGDLDDVLALVETLPEGADRTWCLTALAGSRAWSAAEWRRITDATSPGRRRHLELRRRSS